MRNVRGSRGLRGRGGRRGRLIDDVVLELDGEIVDGVAGVAVEPDDQRLIFEALIAPGDDTHLQKPFFIPVFTQFLPSVTPALPHLEKLAWSPMQKTIPCF